MQASTAPKQDVLMITISLTIYLSTLDVTNYFLAHMFVFGEFIVEYILQNRKRPNAQY
jgi:hypothetical protein